MSPASEGDLEAVLRKLAAMGRREGWCSSDCATLLEVRLSGKLADGELRVQVRGAVTSEQRAYVELFGARPDAGLDQLLGAGRPVPLYWSGAAYSAVLPPGSFELSGSLRFVPGTPLVVNVPGPAGLVDLDVTDADVVGSGARRGVRDATYQIVPRQAAGDSGGRLRLLVDRRFELGRERLFSVAVGAQGARPGQVIRLPLLAGEQVEELDQAGVETTHATPIG